VLYALGGASLQLPTMALLSIVNDRAAIPPAYLPAYGAVAFLPWSFKPLYAFLSTWLFRLQPSIGSRRGSLSSLHQSNHYQEQRYRMGLVGVLLGLSAGTFVCTALFIPPGGVFLCFVWGFLRGILSAWPELLLGVTLIETARLNTGSGITSSATPATASESRRSQDDNNRTLLAPSALHKYEDVVSVFQSQAATSRNVGSLGASIVTFALFAWRQYDYAHHQGGEGANDMPPPLSEAFVSALLLTTAAVNGVASLIALKYYFYNIRSSSYALVRNSEDAVVNDADNLPESEGNSLPETTLPQQQESRGVYHSVPTQGWHNHEEIMDPLRRASDSDEVQTPPTPTSGKHPAPPEIEGARPSCVACPTAQSSVNNQHYFDISALALFQLLLVLSALRSPIVSITGDATWICLLALAALGLATAIVIPSCRHTSEHQHRHEEKQLTAAAASKAIPPKRLAIYLILRHSVPIAGFIMYSYLYTLFESEPVFLQILSVMSSGALTAATWCYERLFSRKYHSGKSILWLIAFLSVVSALTSLLNLVVIRIGQGIALRMTNAGNIYRRGDPMFLPSDATRDTQKIGTPGIRLNWIALLVTIATNFEGELGFMPSVVLATANVVNISDGRSNDDKPPENSAQQRCSDNEIEVADNSGRGGTNSQLHTLGVGRKCEEKESAVYDESMQYASFLSCIDFGSQIGNWISVPIIASLGITRENHWANLDTYIIICALARVASIAFLCLIRRPDGQEIPMYD